MVTKGSSLGVLEGKLVSLLGGGKLPPTLGGLFSVSYIYWWEDRERLGSDFVLQEVMVHGLYTVLRPHCLDSPQNALKYHAR